MALLTAQTVSATAGLVTPTLTFSAVNSTDTFVPAPGRFLYVKNTNAATRTITITTENTAAGGAAVADWTCTIAATTGEAIMICYPYAYLNNAGTNVATVTYSATAGVTAALIELPQVL